MKRNHKMGMQVALLLAMAFATVRPAGAEMAADESLLHSAKLSIGAESDWIFDRDLIVFGGTDPKINSSQSYRARMGYQVFDSLEIYSLLGASDLELKASAYGETITEEFGFGFLWGGGACIHHELPDSWWNLLVNLDGRFTQWESALDGYRDSVSGNFPGPRGNVRAQAYHAAATVGRKFHLGETGYITPYVGGRWSQFTAEENDLAVDAGDILESSWRADDHIGVIAGITTGLSENWQIAVEGRFVDETALSAKARYRF